MGFLKIHNHSLLAIAALLSFLSVFGQRGPGGVTDDSDDQKNCRLWLDAGDLNLSDQSNVTLWLDRSVSNVLDSAFFDNDHNYLPPLYRNDPSNGINGKPVISFEDGGMLSIGKWTGTGSQLSEDLNTNPTVRTTYQQTIFIVFRTSNDVTTRQILWEEGGGLRGFNIQLYDGHLLIGAYDAQEDGPMVEGGGDLNVGGSILPVPEFGYSYKKLAVQPNSTYVASMVYDVPTNNTLLTSPNAQFSGLTGTLNGQPFPIPLEYDCCEATGVGGVYAHPGSIGVGALNEASYNENGQVFGVPGTLGFSGRIAEICYYAFAVTPCQRIIIENYLAAKYFANAPLNDRYDYQTSFGDDVIGIGKENNTDFHNVSQGKNLFEISVDNFSSTFNALAPQYLLVGHNNTPLSWTDQNVPDTTSFRRTRRIWRFDRSGTLPIDKELHLKFDSLDLPALPAGFSKYAIVVDTTNGFLPNFTSSSLQVVGLELTSGTYQCDVDILDGSYLTLAAIIPTVNFDISSKSVIEGDGVGTFTTEEFKVRLNYSPSPFDEFSATIEVTDGSAESATDYTWNSGTSLVEFAPGPGMAHREQTRSVNIDHDDVALGDAAIEEFYVSIISASETSASPETAIAIGQRDSITYRILDNDPPPKLTFEEPGFIFNEAAGVIKIPMEIVGDLSGFTSATATIIIRPSGNSAAENVDYTYAPVLLSFSSLVPRDTVLITLIDDDLNEINEVFGLEIQSATDIAFSDTLNIAPEITIVDNDNPPTVSFLAASSEGYEGIGDPRIYVELSAPSSKEIVIPFAALSTGTATNSAVLETGSDYDAEVNSSLIIPPGDTLSFIYYDINSGATKFIVNSDEVDEPDETAIFELDSDPINAQIGAIVQHTYFIRDYVEFEFAGIAGVGKNRDNTIVVSADEAVDPGNIPNLSPRNIEIIQSQSNNQPSIEPSVLNNRNVLRFDGDDFLAVGDPSTAGRSSLINTAGFYDGKSIFLVITPHNAASTMPQTIFEQGDKSRGLSIYLQDSRLYFQGWNLADDGDNSPWGSMDSLAFVESTTPIEDDSTYIISAHYLNNMFVPALDDKGLKLYVNGVLEDSYTGDVGRLYTHGGRTAIGGVWNNSFSLDGPVETGSGSANYYVGDIAEMIYFNEPNRTNAVRMNDARINIIHNHLSAKYNIPLDGAQYFDITSNGDASSSSYFGHDVAGIAQVDTAVHGDSKGKAEIRVHTPNYTGTGDYYAVWGHQGGGMTDTWPVSYWNAPIENPIQERSGRIWRFFTDAADGELTAQIEIDYSESDNADLIEPEEDEYLRLLIHKNPDPTNFSSLDTIIAPQSAIEDGNTVIFIDVPITDGMYVSLGNTSSINNLPLPIELLSFDAKLSGSYVDLTWSTATEINNDYFVIERTGEDLDWKPIITVTGAGNSNSLIHYEDKDRDPLKGLSYYRLKQVDFDGGHTYSDPVSVFNNSIADGEDIFMYPNPSAMGSVFLRLPHAVRDFQTDVKLFDLKGRHLASERFDTRSDIFEFHYGELKPGIYLVQIQSNAINATKKLVVR